MNNVTFFLTSCKRHDLLKVCLESFEKYNTYPIERGIIIEDSDMDIEWTRDILKSIPNLELINTGGRQGQLKNIDRCYAMIDTEYVFHCEDDFVFIREGFIEPSIKILEHDPACINVWLTQYYPEWELDSKADNLTNHGRTLPPYHRQFKLDDITYWNVNNVIYGEWGLGFTFQPAVHRLEDWRRYGGYQSIIDTVAPWCNRLDGGQVERNLCRHYVMDGFRTFMLAGPGDKQDGYVNTTGHQRHVNLPGSGE